MMPGGTCTFKYAGSNGTTPTTAAPTPAKPSLVPSCANYKANEIVCAQQPKGWMGGDNADQKKIDAELDAATKKCAQTMCTTLKGGVVLKDPQTYAWFCEVKNSTVANPTDCASGTNYMKQRSVQQTCIYTAQKEYLKKRDALFPAVTTWTGKVGKQACATLSACQAALISIALSASGKKADCERFFEAIKKSYPWSTKCNQKQV